MFQQLRLNLTLINTAIIVLLFLLLIVGTYSYAQFEMNRHTNYIAEKITADIQTGLTNDIPQHGTPPSGPPPGPPGNYPPGPPPGPNFFFVKTSPVGAITFQSSGHPLDVGGLETLTAKALQTDRPKGTVMFGESEYFYLKSPLANPPGILVVFHDLSHELNLLRVVLTALVAAGILCALLSLGASFYLADRAMIPIQQSWQQQKDFLSDASHELRTPLAVIQTNLDVVIGSPDETISSQSKWLDNIREESLCMAKLVNSLLFLARADSEEQPLDKQSFSVDTALLRAAAPFEAVAAAKGVHLNIIADTAIMGYGDEARIKQTIGILLDNAIRHTPSGGKVSVCLAQTDKESLLTVADSGEGIEPEFLGKIFDRFYQVDKSRSKGGAGLGLVIAKWIVEKHGGAITVSSIPGTGTTFTVLLPNK